MVLKLVQDPSPLLTWSCPNPPPDPRPSRPARRRPSCTPQPGPVGRGDSVLCVSPKSEPWGHWGDMWCPCYLFAETRGLPLQVLVAPIKTRAGDMCEDTHTSPPFFGVFCGVWTHSAAIMASCSARRTAASSSSLDNGGPVSFLPLAYQVRSFPFCHRPTGAIREFPVGTTTPPQHHFTPKLWERGQGRVGQRGFEQNQPLPR